MKVQSNIINFIDLTDSVKLEVHIASNLPTVQIYDVNTQTFTPNWENGLTLTPTVYLDNSPITDGIIYNWYEKTNNGLSNRGTTKTLSIKTNELSNKASGMVTYQCEVAYDNKTAISEITFVKTNTGLNGSSAPQVLAQYSVDGISGWTTDLNDSHKYVHFSYNGGATWSEPPIKIVGEDGSDGTSVTILGSYNTLSALQAAHPIGNPGNSYMVDGDLYVWNTDTNSWQNVGQIQGPPGAKGDSYYLFIRYADNASGSGISAYSEGKSYIGFYRSSVNQVPADISAATWNWTKFVGEDAKSVSLTASAQVFKVASNGSISPSSITVTAQTYNTTIDKWEYSIDGGQKFNDISTGASYGISIVDSKPVIDGATMTTNSVVIKASGEQYSDIITIYKVTDGVNGADGKDGQSAPIAFLTNENISFVGNTSGQITATTVYSNIVAYRGTDKILPTIGTITGMPSGMKITHSNASNEIVLNIAIDNNSTLGSSSSLSGEITIPVLTPVATNLKLSWSKINTGATGAKGDTGVGVRSTTVTYGVSDSASTRPADTAWQATIPTVADGKYLWTRTITDYTNDSVPDTVTYTYAKQGVKGETGSSGSSVTVSSIQYQAGTSATTAPTGTWSNSVVSVAEGSYLWTKTTFSDGNIAYGVAKQGEKGSAGIDAYTVILSNESHIFAGDISNAIAGTATTQVLAYKGAVAQSVTIISVNGKTAATTDTDTGITGLKFKCSALNSTSTTITFTCTNAFIGPSGTIPIVLSVGGVQFTKMFTYSIAFKGITGSAGQAGTPASLVDITPSALYFKSTTGKDGTFTPDYIYLYPRFQTVTYSKWEYSINGGTSWTTIVSGSNGLTIGTYGSVANSLQIAKNSALYTDTVTSISFRCVSSNASVYDTVSIAKIYDVVDLQIGGRNLLLNSGTPVTNSTYNIKKYDLSIKPTVGEQYTITIKGALADGKTSFSAYNSGGNVSLGALARVGTSDIYQRTFAWTNNNRTDLDTSVFIYAMPNSVTAESTIEWIKLEKGNKATDWSPAPEDLKTTTFQLYAPKGYLITKDVPEVTLQTFAYDGSQVITGATFAWYSWVNNAWVALSGETGTSLVLNRGSILKSNVYKCIMTYNGKTYEATATVEDKTDIYESLMCISSNATGNDCYWVLYTLVYNDVDEVDPLLGPISINAPTSPVSGNYWYAVDATNASVQLKKYDGTSWVNSTDTQSLSYYWDIVNDGSVKVPFGDSSKVQVVSCHDFTATATLVCKVSNVEDGLLTQSSLSLTDTSDPIVSATEPTNVVDGQIWIKPNDNGTYFMSIWDATKGLWIASDMDTRTKVYSSRPSSYSVGDLWITASDTDHGSYIGGTLLQSDTTSTTYNASHWSPTLKYDKDLDKIKETLNDLSQYVNITSEGLKIGAQSASGEISPFTSLFTSTELAFYQNSDKLLTLSNNQLIAPHIVVEDDLDVGKTISLGNLNLTIETNGSFSFAVSK